MRSNYRYAADVRFDGFAERRIGKARGEPARKYAAVRAGEPRVRLGQRYFPIDDERRALVLELRREVREAVDEVTRHRCNEF